MADKILVAMSGGVDSSVAAYLLKREGYEVAGVFMRNGVHHEGGGNQRSCCSVEDAHDARRVADILGIPFYVLNFEEEFKTIIDYFVREYNEGKTPNPCVVCNRDLKFGKLFDYAEALKADKIATGHYAVVDKTDFGYRLRKARDGTKDQSYVLFPLKRDDLPRVILPLGGLTKPEVRELAGKAGLPVKDKPDSQEICFVPDDNYGGLIAKLAPDAIGAGEIVTADGKSVGKHDGYQFYTIGQRKGIGAHGVPQYVVDIDAKTHSVVIGGDDEVMSREMDVERVNWVSIDPPPAGRANRFSVKIRYRHTPADAEVTTIDGGEAVIRFDAPQRAITPGQAAVFYDGDIVVGGGWIRKAKNERCRT